ncbi:glycosyltransferase family 4 protein [Bacillus cereus group sp. LD113LC]|uniref:glycosyltransferase family 4 protein n=1 Tax=Bacillus TaxID=1386 RepID=UPI0007AB287C|nr:MULTISPECIES: glycosyltransferase family 4 protein [Bacillus]AYY29662.1 glycosyltransferase WbuB [Bacillus sp. FDAARGOS_527]KZD54486.1 Glycosyltransferase [Bacillus cereus]KZD64797.1 Glycosyltransferase [Bacillus cereus]MCU4735396.1 glycosyltransferase family 4 protein [Bacillus paranthracis]MCU4865380.1 glycosyltransferase family 4 protein [Bacillus paranthracis]
MGISGKVESFRRIYRDWVKKVKDILIIAHFTQVPGEVGNGRFNYIAEKIDKQKANVEIVTTNFSHRTKKQRNVTNEQKQSISYKLTMLKEPGYTKNVSFKRFYSHYVMGRNLRKYLSNRKKPDVIYCAVPSLDVAKTAAKYAKKHNIRFIIDVQDLWPEAFKMVFNIPVIKDIIFYPMKRKAEYIYSTADEIVAVSQTYADRALKANNKGIDALGIYLGTELAYFDNLAEQNKLTDKPNNEMWLVYIGTLGHSYDICSVIDALKIVKDKGINNIKFVVMGDGPHKSKFETYAKKLGVNAVFPGRLGYDKMVGILKSCDIAVNPIKQGSAGSIINKVGDYAAAGLPVLNTQESNEYKELVEGYRAGFNCINGCALDLSEKLIALINDEKLKREMGKNNRKLAETLFDREKTYNKISNLMGEELS